MNLARLLPFRKKHTPPQLQLVQADVPKFSVAGFAARLWGFGFRPSDFKAVADGIVILSPIRPPAVAAGGLLVPHTATDIAGTMCIVHRVEQVGRLPANVLQVKRGDVVVTRLSHLDPLHVNTNTLAIEARHIYAILEPADGDG